MRPCFQLQRPRRNDSQRQIQGINTADVWENRPAYSACHLSWYGITAHQALSLFSWKEGVHDA